MGYLVVGGRFFAQFSRNARPMRSRLIALQPEQPENYSYADCRNNRQEQEVILMPDWPGICVQYAARNRSKEYFRRVADKRHGSGNRARQIRRDLVLFE